MVAVICMGIILLLLRAYTAKQARLIVREMTDSLVYDLVEKELETNQIVLTIGYDIENLTNPQIRDKYYGEITRDHYGRMIPKHAHGTTNLERYTSSSKVIIDATIELYDKIINPDLLVRRITVCAAKLVTEEEAQREMGNVQLDLFTDYGAVEETKKQEDKEKSIQKAVIGIKKKFGKNAILKGMNLEEGATAKERNEQIGGHKA